MKEVGALELPSGYEQDYTFEQFRHELETSKTELSPLVDCGFVPKFDLVYGEGSGRWESGYIVMPRVTGRNLNDTPTLETSVAVELDKHLAVLLSSGRTSPPDILSKTNDGAQLRGIIIGKLADDEMNHPYLVDVYPLGSWNDRKAYLETFLEAVMGIEAKANSYVFTQTRGIISNELGDLN